jgi:hypothetical protein
MGKFRFSLLLLSLATLLAGCEVLFFDDLSSMQQVTVSDKPYKFVEVRSSFNITLKQQDEFDIIVDAPEELIDGIEIFIANDSLIVNDTNKYQWTPSYKIPKLTLCFPNLPNIHIKAPVDMSTEGTITQPSLRIITTSHTGRVNLDVDMNSLSIVTGNTYDSGIFTVSGSASSASFWMRNSATLHALDLVSGNVRVVNNSKGDSYVCTDGNLRVTINSFGNIYYQGNPQQIVVEEMSSTGSLIPLN